MTSEAFGSAVPRSSATASEYEAFASVVPDSIEMSVRAECLVRALQMIGGSLRPNGNSNAQAVRWAKSVERPGPTVREARGRLPSCTELARQQFFMASGLGHLAVARDGATPTPEEALVSKEMEQSWKAFYSRYGQKRVIGQQLRRGYRQQLQPKAKRPFTGGNL